MATKVMQMIEKMKGVTHASLYHETKSEENAAQKEYSARIMRTRGIAKNILNETSDDDRLNYLLSK